MRARPSAAAAGLDDAAAAGLDDAAAAGLDDAAGAGLDDAAGAGLDDAAAAARRAPTLDRIVTFFSPPAPAATRVSEGDIGA
jgi:hypothetical protein